MRKNIAINPVVMAAGEKNDAAMVCKAEKDSIVAIYPKTPVLLTSGFQLLGMKGGMERIFTKYPLTFFCFLLDSERKFLIATGKFRRISNFTHEYGVVSP